jgi:glycerate dehydrogenase
MKIVVTDGQTLNPGDLNWDELKGLGDYEIYDRSTPAETLERCKNAQIVITNKVVFDRKTLDALPELKCISVTATGYNVIDTQVAREKNIVVTNVPIYGTRSVAQMVFALLLELAHHVGHHSQTVHEGKWSNSNDWCYWDHPLIELADLTMGIIGCGRIGLATAAIARAFGMKVLGHNRSPQNNPDIQVVSQKDIFTQSDTLSLHCPLTPENEGFINKQQIELMKPSAFLINTSRGQLINEQDLADALNSNRIAGAGLDVLSTEPPKPENPLLTAKNCIITPHMAWATHASRARLMKTSIDNVKAFIDGKLHNVVNGL